MGNPGSNAMRKSIPLSTVTARGYDRSCLDKSCPRSFFDDTRVIRMPAAVEVTNAGTCDANPSPIDSSVNRWMASPMVMPF